MQYSAANHRPGIFALFPRSEAIQLEEIEQIKKANPGFVLVWDDVLDGNEDLRFRNTIHWSIGFSKPFRPIAGRQVEFCLSNLQIERAFSR
jgi:hypothetical protein